MLVIENVPEPDDPQLDAVNVAAQSETAVSPGAVGVAVVSQSETIDATAPEDSALKAAFFALIRADPILLITTEARIPMIAITTKSSIRVKPLFIFFIRMNKKIINNDFACSMHTGA